ncbi:MAG: VWA domain-containing protein [Myxococcales bacterium]|nr:VWA domain-containing protein [Myxococcales bacterium]
MRWLYPLVFLALIPFSVWWFWARRRFLRQRPALAYSSLQLFEGAPVGLGARLVGYKDLLLGLACFLVLVALARPQKILAHWPRWDKGVDVVFALDVSSSMLQQDLQPNRIEVTRKALIQWSKEKRQREDRLGLVLFARQAYTVCPLTSDHKMLREMIDHIQIGVLEDDTAIGDAIASSIARLRHSKLKQRAIILLTDGENNSGQVHPMVAAGVAKQMKIPVYALLVGKRISPVVPTQQQRTPWRVLQDVAERSGGKAWRARDAGQIQKILSEILDRIAPQRRKKPTKQTLTQELFGWFAWPALALLLLFALLDLGPLREPL